MPKLPKRDWSPYELSELAKAGIALSELDEVGETPVEYLTGHVAFAGLDFLVSPAVLIPRIESEELVAHARLDAQKSWQAHQQPLTLLDIGTGSGALGVSLASLLERVHIPFQLYLSDISDSALVVARQNAQRLLPESQENIVLLQSDLLTSFPPVQADLILANLPYIPSGRVATLDESVQAHEPHLALDGGPDGLSLIHTLLTQAEKYLKKTGQIWLEVDHTHTATAVIGKTNHPNWSAQLLNDQFGRGRFVVIKE